MLLPLLFILCANFLLCDATDTTTCEGSTLNIKCSAGNIIKILDADYGRHSYLTCVGLPISLNRNCSANDSLEIVKRRCNDQDACSIAATNKVFGDPCPGTHKYLTVNYTCELIHKELQELITCENHNMILSCSDGMSLEIIYAIYGRSCEDQCRSPGLRTDMNCSAANSSAIVKNSCNGLNMCFVNVTNHIFGDPCPDVAKYLEVNYTCNIGDNTGSSRPTSTTTLTKYDLIKCQNSIMNIDCPTGLINIIYANFGRTSLHPCQIETSTPTQNDHCVNDNSTEIVRRSCENKNGCSVNASTSVFGDTCPGTVSYLEVTYDCVEDPNIHEIHACENNKLTINCNDGETIDIISVVYGRLSNSICTTLFSGNCSAKDALNIVDNKCDNKQSCTIEASNTVFGNPCLGTDKYLQVNYTCLETTSISPSPTTSTTSSTTPTTPTTHTRITPKHIPPTTVRACQNTMLVIGCPDERINIVYANFGRTSPLYCLGGNVSETCVNDNSTEIVRQNCDNKETCTISASSSVFGPSCPGTSNYLEVVYYCTELQVKSACENTTITISCEAPNTIDIDGAIYGRLSNSVCSTPNLGNFNCSAEGALTIIEDSCYEKESCTIGANNSLFGDPCPGIDKYLQINYTCLDTSTKTTPTKPTQTSPTTPTTTKHETIPPTTVRACQNMMLVISCPGEHINIVYANFGRTSPLYCLGGNVNKTCVNDNSTEIVRQNCDNKETCFISASTRVFGPDCSGTSSYLEVEYYCTELQIKSACENTSLPISCETPNTTISIVGVVYGRLSSSICDTSNPGSLNCSAKDALGIVESSCEGKKTCLVEASSQIFGDPCSGIEKYLQINYTCLTMTPPIIVSSGNDPVILNGTACQDSNLTISCPSTDYIFIYKANYGRLSNNICLSPYPLSDQNINCTSPGSTNIVANRCDGLITCTINASDSVFTDTCASTYKYLEVEYVCLHRITTEIPVLNETACENTTLSINCSTDATINITSANYGRTSSLVCPRPLQDQLDNCTDAKSFNIVSNSCTGHESCSISATNSEFGNDPCPETFKYLEVHYDCLNKVDPIPFSGTACDGVTLELKCPAGLHMQILAAIYGRLGNSICPKRGVDNVNNCLAVNSTEIVSQRCNGKDNCSIQASNSTFGDPCPGIYKYLVVYYSCIGSYLQCGINEHINCSNHCSNRICGSSIAETCNGICEQGCVCNEGYNRDPLTGVCIKSKYCPLKGPACQTHEHFSRCGADCQSTCTNSTQTCKHCSPGYICNSGFVRDEDTGRCVRSEDCPCSDA